MPSFQRSFAVLPLPLHKFRKNSVSAVRITLLVSTIPLRRCRSYLPLCRNCRSVANRIEYYFCRSAVGAATAQKQNGMLETRQGITVVTLLTMQRAIGLSGNELSD